MMDFAQLIIVAILVESVWENIKMIWQSGKFSINMLGSLIVCILLCVLVKIDICPIVGLNIAVPIIGSIFTGIIVSRGANFVNDLLKRLKGE